MAKVSKQEIERKLATYRKAPDGPLKFVREVIRAEPDEQQQRGLRAISPRGAHVAIRSGHGTGKSTLLSWLVLWGLTCYEDVKIPCTAPSSHQLRDVLLSEIGKWRAQMNPWLRDQLEMTRERVWIKGTTNRFASLQTSRVDNPDSLQGFHGKTMIFIVDEASGVMDSVFIVAKSALSTPGARIMLTGNPTRNSGVFYDAFHKNKKFWTCLHFDGEKSSHVSAKFVNEMREEYGEDSDIYNVRVKGVFPRRGIAQLIGRDLVDTAVARKLHPSQYSFAPKVLGVDTAWMGGDRSIIVMRQGLASSILGSWHNVDSIFLAGVTARFEDQHKTQATMVDAGMSGTGVIDQLRAMGRKPIIVWFGGKANDSTRYINKRVEMWCLMEQWLQDGGSVPDDRFLIADLVGPEYAFSPNGRLQLESKKLMRRRGLHSPDAGDALALTFAVPIVMEPKIGEKLPMAKCEYDVLSLDRDAELVW